MLGLCIPHAGGRVSALGRAGDRSRERLYDDPDRMMTTSYGPSRQGDMR